MNYIYPGLTQLVKDKVIQDFKNQYAYTKPTKFWSQSKHILYKYLLDELEGFDISL